MDAKYKKQSKYEKCFYLEKIFFVHLDPIFLKAKYFRNALKGKYDFNILCLKNKTPLYSIFTLKERF